MNRLYLIKKIGFKVTWKLISVGLYGNREIPVLISRKDITLFLNELLMNNNACADDIIALLCEENYPTDFDVLLHKYASIDKSELPMIPLTGRPLGRTMELRSSIGLTMPTATSHAIPRTATEC